MRRFVKMGLLISLIAAFVLGCTDTLDYTKDRSYIKAKRTSLDYFDGDEVSIERVSSYSKNSEYETFKISNAKIGKKLEMDIYGCNDVHCLSATSIVFHDSSFKYILALKKGEFLFSEPTEQIYTEEFGYDCQIKVAAYWNLKIDTEYIKIDWQMLEAEEVCEVYLYK